MTIGVESGPPKVPLLRDPKLRGLVIQILLCVALAGLVYYLVRAAAANLERSHMASGFGFWNQPAGFDISQSLIDYSSSASTYGRAFWVGLLNTLLVAALGIVLTTIVGFLIGIGRLSSNWLVAHLATGYVHLVRNVPLLLQLLFWYSVVLTALPDFRDSIRVPGGGFLSNRGLFLPAPELGGAGPAIFAALLVGIAAAIAVALAVRRKRLDGRMGAVVAALLVLVPPFAAFLASGATLSIDYP